MNLFHNGYQRGILLPTAAIFSVVGMLTTMSYMSYALNKKINLDHRIANTKALYNAESGLALSYQWLASSNWESDYDSTTFQGNHSINSSMGSYENVILYKSINDITKRIERTSEATGLAVVKNIWGNSKIVQATAEMQFALESLSEYMYLSNHERGGGAPGIYSNWERTQPCFGPDDVLGNETEIAGQLQTMEPMRMCTSPPTFENTIFVTLADEAFVGSESDICDDDLGVEIFPFNGETCGNSRVETCGGILNGESGPEGHECWEAKTKVCFPLQGYHSTVGAASSEHTYDATEMLYKSKNGSDFSTLKDTLIMTDIEFLENGGYQVKRWWYLLPPYLKSDIMTCGDFPGMPTQSPSTIDCPFYGTMAFGFNIQDGNNDLLYPQPFHLEGVTLNETDAGGDLIIEDHCADYDQNIHEGDIRQCEQYIAPLADFHTIQYNPFSENESFITGPWSGGTQFNNNPGGGVLRFSHYDIENFSQYYVDRANDWRDPTNLPPTEQNNDPYWGLDYVDGGQLIQNDFVSAEEAVIHIKGGPVRIHGKYDGRFTVVTSGFDVVDGNGDAGYDGWSTYKRHAWNLDHGPTPVDTVRSNIWIIDNITNSETGSCPPLVSGVCPAQPSIITANTPNAECEVWEYEKPGDCGASNNVMGLVSSSNIIIANSTANRNNGVDIHASLLALNESFTMHFWQNSVVNPNYQVAPMSDGRGVDLYGADNTDERGDIRLWGGIIQEFRGYMMRGATGFPYNGADMGMDKQYNYDNNLFFPPPFYPYRNDCPVGGYEVVSMSLVKYGPIVSSE